MSPDAPLDRPSHPDGQPFLAPAGSETAPVESTTPPPVPAPPPVSVTAAPAGATLSRLAPIAIASALFMEFIDSTSLSTALPTLAREFHSDPVHVKLALTSYLLALAVVAPAGGWVADRLGAKRVFLSAMAVFLVGSVLCGFSRSMPELVAARILQGCGGAMMTPVGRIMIVGSSPKEKLVQAMAWFTTPALVGPLIGPPLAGLVLGVASWPFIFFVNVPVGIAGMVAVHYLAPDIRQPDPGRFDLFGFFITAIAITGVVVTAETVGLGLVPLWAQALIVSVTLLVGVWFVRHVRRAEKPILNLSLLRYSTFRTSLIGGTMVRLGIGATPFLVPLLLQVGLGWSPVKAGLVTIFTGVGALTARSFARRVIGTYGFRSVLLATGVGSAIVTALPAAFREGTPVALIVLAFFVAGMVRSTQFISANTVAYAEVPQGEVSQASTLATVTQQIGLALGVSLGAFSLHLVRGTGGALTPDKFTLPFLMIGLVTLAAQPFYWRLSPDAGSEISGKRTAAA